jgi:site-specific DNA recombinase
MSSRANKSSSTKAVIYCRVSSGKQVSQGHGLESQEMRGREYATRKGYHVVAVFLDEGVSGGLRDRPGTSELLAYLRSSRERVVI